MAITWRESGSGGAKEGGSSTAREVRWIGYGSGDIDQAETDLLATIDDTLGDLVYDSHRVEENTDGKYYEGTVRYKSASDSFKAGDSAFSFNTAGGTKHITKSKETIARLAKDGGTAPDYQGAIGVDGQGNVGGLDIVFPQYEFSETHYFAADDVDNSFKGVIFALTGSTNNATFKGLEEGECLFKGASGSQKQNADWEITFHWAGSPTTTVTFGDNDPVEVKGFDHIWWRFEDQDDTSAHATVKRPTAMYVERVYDPGDFALLGVGT